MRVTYTAKRSLVSSHSYGAAYSFDVPVEGVSPSNKINRTRHVSLGRQAETWLNSVVKRLNIRTIFLSMLTPQRINYATNSQNFASAHWTKSSNINIVENTDIAPDGSNTVSFIQENTTTSGTHAVSTAAAGVTLTSLPIGTLVTASIYARASQRTHLSILVLNNTTGGYFWAVFDVVTGAHTPCPSNVDGVFLSGHSEDVGDGYFRISITGRFTTVASVRFHFYLSIGSTTTNGYAGTNGYGMYVWGAQYEVSDKMTAYIPSTDDVGLAPAPYAQMVEFLDSVADGTQFTLDLTSETGLSHVCELINESYDVQYDVETHSYAKYSFDAEII